jgi:hypothetical protein
MRDVHALLLHRQRDAHRRHVEAEAEYNALLKLTQFAQDAVDDALAALERAKDAAK